VDFQLSAQQVSIKDAVADLARRFGLDYWRERDLAKEFPTEMWSALGQSGWLGIAIPQEYGGGGMGVLELALVVEEACRAGSGATLSQLFMATPVFGAETLKRHGSEAQRRKYLPRLAAGNLDLCMALTEPNAGSNTLAIQTQAKRDGDDYRVSGQKVWITAIDRAERVLVVARTTPLAEAPRRSHGISLLLAETSAPGISYQPLEKLGTNCLGAYSVYLDNVAVPAEDLIGGEDNGWRCILDTLNAERIITAAGCIATGEIALQLATEYASSRVVFDRPIGSYQAVQFPLARAKIALDMARLMNYKAAWLYDNGKSPGVEANMAKYIAADAAFSACDAALQSFGGNGYSVDNHIARLWRDIRLFRLAPVTQEMILNYVAQHVLRLPRSY
jgi:acyl-CoA dehydrogenase